MEETYNAKAIILDRESFKEADIKLVVLTESRGKLELVARGARKIKSKLSGHIEPLTLSKLMIVKSRNDFDYLGTSSGDNFFVNIKNDLNKLTYAGHALNLVNNLSRVEEIETKSIFILLKDFLNILDAKKGINSDLLYNFFVLKFLSASGFGPNLQTCVTCCAKISQGGNCFNLDKGGLVCKKCSSKERGKSNSILRATDDCIKILRFGASNNFEKISNLKIERELNKDIGEKISLFLKYNFHF